MTPEIKHAATCASRSRSSSITARARPRHLAPWTFAAIAALAASGFSTDAPASAGQAARFDDSRQRSAGYERDLKDGLARILPSGVDSESLIGLVGDSKTATTGPAASAHIAALAKMPTLTDMSTTIGKLRKLSADLALKHRLKAPRANPSDYLNVNDERATTPRGRALESWLALRSLVANTPVIVIQPLPSTRATTSPRRWRQPIRIAATGDSAIDAKIASALADLRRVAPGLPIDASSFPNSVEQANLFIDWNGVQCTMDASCRPHDVSPEVRAANTRYAPNSAQSEMLRAAAFFDQIESGRWTPRSDILPLSAYVGLKVATAWLRLNSAGDVDSAVCSHVVDRDGGPAPAVTNVISSAGIRACLGAAMGAPSTAPQWSVRQITVFRPTCCGGQATPATTYSQDNLLRQLYP